MAEEKIRTKCPNCGTHIVAPITAAGKRGKYSKCKASIVLPLGEGNHEHVISQKDTPANARSTPDRPDLGGTPPEETPHATASIPPGPGSGQGDVPFIRYNCTACQVPLMPQKFRCSSCGSFQSPWFHRIVPAILITVVTVALIGGIMGGLRTNELEQALAVMVPIFLIAAGASWGLFAGSVIGWHLFTMVLGGLLLGVLAALIISHIPWGGFSAFVIFWSTAVHTGINWRARRLKTSRRTTYVYLALNVPFLLINLFHTGECSGGVALMIGIYVALFLTLIVWTYSIRVRWWYRIRAGWTGPYLDGSETQERVGVT